ncbi:MAG TPA: hypothetical protein PLI09_28330 [Candidatus Hydrogenedentes bacterium]|nr:hypothetical protein [Candidatus Hydrogenedentota bacterium]
MVKKTEPAGQDTPASHDSHEKLMLAWDYWKLDSAITSVLKTHWCDTPVPGKNYSHRVIDPKVDENRRVLRNVAERSLKAGALPGYQEDHPVACPKGLSGEFSIKQVSFWYVKRDDFLILAKSKGFWDPEDFVLKIELPELTQAYSVNEESDRLTLPITEYFQGEPPRNTPQGIPVEDLLHWGYAMGMEPTPLGKELFDRVAARGLSFLAICPDGEMREIPLTIAQHNYMVAALRTAKRPNEPHAYHAIWSQFLTDTGPHPWNFDRDYIEVKVGEWYDDAVKNNISDIKDFFDGKDKPRLNSYRKRKAASGKGNSIKPNGRLAEALGVDDWGQIEVKVLANGIQYRRAGTGDAFLKRDWGALGVKGKTKVSGLLINIAKFGGTYPNPHKEKRWDIVHDLNTAFMAAFGLSKQPFHNVRRLGTQSNISSISWGGR